MTDYELDGSTLVKRELDDVPYEVYQYNQILGGNCDVYWTGLVYIVVQPETGVATVVDKWSGVRSSAFLDNHE